MMSSLRLVFWETTKACNLSCRHCRAVPQRALGPMELTTRRAFDLIDQIAEVAKPVFVLSGGEPLFRPDLFDIGAYGVETGFRMALATNGTLVDGRVAAKIADAGFSRVAISLDGANPETHDRFRGQRAHGTEGEGGGGDMSSTFISAGTRARAAPTVLGGGHHGQHLSAMTRGCLAGTSVCFVSNEGEVYPCGYLPVSAGDTRLTR